MEHVPTLCAISTVGIAAAGFALGRQEPTQIPRPPSNKRKAPGTSNGTHRSFSSPFTGTTMTSPKYPPQTPPLLSEPVRPFSQHIVNSRPQSSKIELEGLGIQDGTAFPNSEHSRRGSTRASTPGFDDAGSQIEFKGSGLAKPSWLRRISTISSHNDSPTSSPRPASSSISFSNTSTAPILSTFMNPSPASLPPNKLVKRTASQRVLATHQTPRSSSLPQGPTFRRPATSHQRSATMRQAAMDGSARDNDSNEPRDFESPSAQVYETPETSTSHIWRPYFSRGYPKANSGPRKRHTSGFSKVTPVNHVVKDSDTPPTLVLATEISPRLSEDELDDTAVRLSKTAQSRPDSPFEFQPEITPAQESLQAQLDRERKPRHSFSISDMFSASSPSSWISRSGSLRMKKTRAEPEGTNRTMSSPVPQTARSLRKSGRLQRRRNITDGGIFETPRTFASEPGHQDDEDMMEGVMSSPLPPVDRVSAFNIHLPGGAPSYPSTPVLDVRHSPYGNPYVSSPSVQSAGSPNFPPTSRPNRASMATSDPNSTLIGSDTVASGEDSEMDFQSDTAYDSMATRATASSNSGARGPRIETIFDESPPPEVVKEKLVTLENLISRGSFDKRKSNESSRHSMMDEDEDFPTPVRPSHAEEEYDNDSMPPLRDEIDSSNRVITSSPLITVSTKLNGLKLYAQERQDSPVDWDFEDATEDWDRNGEPRQSIEDNIDPLARNARRVPSSHDRFTFSDENGSSPAPLSNGDRDIRSSLFDWSESQKDSPQGSVIRPKTVHGKQGPEGRGSRTSGRRGPSALHLRSQSVPVSREPVLPHESYSSAAKYGTWGLGNKGVSEDWNDDFDFDEADEKPSSTADDQMEEDLTESRLMKVPQAIMERQASVHGQFGQVQELNLLVEELKRLRTQASMLDLLDSPSSELWKEAEGIINLATLDDDENLFPPRSPSSPSFNFDAFDDDSPPTARSRKQSMRTSERGTSVRLYDESESRRSSVIRSSPNPLTPPAGRPRKESSAKAKSVLETIYHQRGGFEPALNELRRNPGNRLPFDTQSLRDLVVRAGVVTRALKEIVRRAEGVASTPNTSPARSRDRDPPFSQIFNQQQSPVDESPSRKVGLPKSRSANGYLGGSLGSNDSDLSGHMKLMTVV